MLCRQKEISHSASIKCVLSAGQLHWSWSQKSLAPTGGFLILYSTCNVGLTHRMILCCPSLPKTKVHRDIASVLTSRSMCHGQALAKLSGIAMVGLRPVKKVCLSCVETLSMILLGAAELSAQDKDGYLCCHWSSEMEGDIAEV
jgi:hypothetical protein